MGVWVKKLALKDVIKYQFIREWIFLNPWDFRGNECVWIMQSSQNLNKFLICYNTSRKHGRLTKELYRTSNFNIWLDEFCAIALNGMVQCGKTWQIIIKIREVNYLIVK